MWQDLAFLLVNTMIVFMWILTELSITSQVEILDKFQYMAKDKDGRDVFLAESGYLLQMAQSDFEKIRFHFTSEF